MTDDDKVQAVIDAWTIEGPLPEFHYRIKRRVRREWPTLGRALDALATAADPAASSDVVNDPTRPRTRPLSADELQQVADIYRRGWNETGRPVEAVAEALNMPRSTASKRIMKARIAGYLPPAKWSRKQAR